MSRVDNSVKYKDTNVKYKRTSERNKGTWGKYKGKVCLSRLLVLTIFPFP